MVDTIYRLSVRTGECECRSDGWVIPTRIEYPSTGYTHNSNSKDDPDTDLRLTGLPHIKNGTE